jgi:hypothetical protein
MRSKIVVSRKWNSPDIEAFVSVEEIGAACSVPDFISILTDEVGNPTLLVTKAALKAKLQQGWAKLEKELKDSTKYI